ncbi:MAG: mechanosensitive ion channel family protein [Pseudomonadota bacterium]
MRELEKLQQFFDKNDDMTLLTAVGITVACMLVIALIKRVVLQRFGAYAAKTPSKLDDVLVDTVRATRLWLLLFPAIMLGAEYLELSTKVSHVIKTVATVALFSQLGLWTSRLVRVGILYSSTRTFDVSEETATSLGVLNFVGQTVLWSIIALVALDNLGINVTALITGLGVGGVAIALAVQNILGDLFASLSIVIDKPFVAGDFIIVDDYMGTVEHIGVKTTRLRSLSGEQIIFANNDLLKSRVRNYKRMYERRVIFQLHVLYKTTSAQLEKIPDIIKNIILSFEKIRFERAHFSKLGDSTLDFEVVYWVLDADYNLYMDIQQGINLKLLRAFESEGVKFANPTQTLIIDSPAEVHDSFTFDKQDIHDRKNMRSGRTRLFHEQPSRLHSSKPL